MSCAYSLLFLYKGGHINNLTQSITIRILKMDFKQIYTRLLTDAFMTLDLGESDMTSPARLCGAKLVCRDGSEVELDLMIDEGEYCFWVKYSGRYFELPLCSRPDAGDDREWFKSMRAEEANAVDIMQRITEGGKEYLEQLINEEGILPIRCLIITEKRMDSIMKLPVSCALAAYGQVFHGIRELEEYCAMQEDSSAPYVLKRSHIYSEKNDYDQTDTLYCRNYLICSNKTSAETWMRDFIGMGRVSALKPKEIWLPTSCPPLVCYVDGCRHFVLLYQ